MIESKIREAAKNQDGVTSLPTATVTLLPSQLAMILLTVVAILTWLKMQVLRKRLTRRRRSTWMSRNHCQEDLERGRGRMMIKRIGEAANNSNIKMRHQR